MQVAERIADTVATLTPAERRVATVVVEDPTFVAFGTVADLAARASVGAATVVRFATKVGFQGFVALQSAVRDEGVAGLRPAAARIRRRASADPLDAHRASAVAAVESSLAAVSDATFAEVVALLATASAVHVVGGEGCDAVAALVADRLDSLRPDVVRIAGSPVAVTRAAARVAAGDVVVAVDVARYDAWLVDVLDSLAGSGARTRRAAVVAVTDSPLSPLAPRADHVLVASTASPGPFDSVLGLVAVVELVVDGLAARLRRSAARRLDAVESSWTVAGVLRDD